MSVAAEENCYYVVMVSITDMNTSLTELQATFAETANLFSEILNDLYEWGSDVLEEDANEVEKYADKGDSDELSAAQTKYDKDSQWFTNIQGQWESILNGRNQTVNNLSTAMQQLISFASVMNQDGPFIASLLAS